jgi:predicted lipoprotein with Yx(FWY)xxD motif
MKSPSVQLPLGLVLAVAGACGNNSGATHEDASPRPDVTAAGDAPAGTANVTLTTDSLGTRLVDAQGKTLYFFVNDVAGKNTSAYSGASWPAFDVQSPIVGSGLTASDFGRFDRGGGVFQTTWKGRPLYYYGNDTATAPTAGEGLGGRWFVARDYTLFFGANSGVTPKGAPSNGAFLTDAAGRTLYVFAFDTRGSGGGSPTSACGSPPCSTHWPQFHPPTSAVLPSTVAAADVTSFSDGGTQQVVYKGWPLYYFASDTAPGDVAGASISYWYTVAGGWNGMM